MSFGVERLVKDLIDLGFSEVSTIKDSGNNIYALITNYEILAGNFAGKEIKLAIPAPAQYPQLLGASIHLCSEPHLVEFGSIPNVRNVIASPLGAEWQYWSYQFKIGAINPTSELLSQINEIFRKN